MRPRKNATNLNSSLSPNGHFDYYLNITYKMGKKCIPGVLCIENMTLFVLVLILFFAIYVYRKSLTT